ncbi:MAG: ATP-dependent Clp protease ATP-binding subunit [Clostridiales bacterium]|nr:ATP-dependent Clp protease ATP-binding subunit [Clostridiales bacterium]
MGYEDRFTEGVKNVLNMAYTTAAELGHSYVGSEHILVGLARESSGTAAKTLKNYGMSAEKIQTLVESNVGKGTPGQQPNQGLTPRAKRIIERGVAEAARLGHSYMGTEHLLMGMLREYDCLGTRLLSAAGIDINRLYTDLLSSLGGDFNAHPPSFQGPAATGHAPVQPKAQHRRSDTKTLDQFSRDLTDLASKGTLDPVIGRDNEIQRVIQILSRRTKNNPVLIGEPGVGKTAIIEGLAQKVVSGDVPENLKGKRVVTLDLSGMVAGTKYRGDFEERIKTAMDEVQKAGNIILFIDELHTIIGAGAAEGAIDAANIIKPALGRGEIQVIGATTLNEYRKHIEKDAALERRFQPVTVDEPTTEETIEILKGLRDRYEAHHKLKITDEAIEAAVTISIRYINDRFLPDKAIDLIDEASSRVRMECLTAPPDLKALETKLEAVIKEKDEAVRSQNFEKAAKMRDEETKLNAQMKELRERWEKTVVDKRETVTPEDIAAVVSSWTGIPVTSLTEDESRRLLRMEEILHKRVVGQDEAVTSVSKAIRRGRVGLKDPKRPTGSFLFLGPTGVGKTELCRALAEAMFGDENAIIKIDMSEYMEKHTVSKLIGSPPGYVGYDEGGQLTEKVRRRPYSVVLFDEIEKAHSEVFNIMLQIMEDGVLTDAQGRRVDFKNTIIVMTSNVGAKKITDDKKPLGFTAVEDSGIKSQEEIKSNVMTELKRVFKPEFLNRIDDIIVFHQLSKENIREIAGNMLKDVADRVANLGITLTAEDEAIGLLAEAGFDPIYGARPLRRTIQSTVEDGIAEKMLDGTFSAGDTVVLKAVDGKVEITKQELNAI